MLPVEDLSAAASTNNRPATELATFRRKIADSAADFRGRAASLISILVLEWLFSAWYSLPSQQSSRSL
jgi:hypothetical protein